MIIVIAGSTTGIAGIIKAKQMHKSGERLNSSDVSEDHLAQLKQEVEQISSVKKKEQEKNLIEIKDSP